MRSRRRRPARSAVIDLGSNALRLQIVEAGEGGEPVLLTRDRVPVRLGEDVYRDGAIGEAALAAAEGALGRFAELCAQYGVQRVRAVATAALREAANRAAVVERLSAVSPAPVEVISGTEEAWLLSRAVAGRMPEAVARGRSLLVDLGGGSVETIVLDDGRAVLADSHPLGAVRLLESARRQAGAAHGPAFLELLEQHAARCDHRIRDRLAERAVDRLVACGGSVEALADLAAEHGGRRLAGGVEALPLDVLERWIGELAPLDPPERARRFGLLPDRADVILPAAVVLRHLARLAGVEALQVPRVGLRDGLERDVLADPDDPTAREAWRDTVLACARVLAARYHCHPGHAERVRAHAAALFDQTRALHGQGPRERTLLETAALLHDAGRFVSNEDHHEHGAWLIRASEIVGLSAPEREQVALAARYHRGPHPAAEDAGYRELSASARGRVCVLAGLLRLADALDRQHCGAVAEAAFAAGPEPGRAHLRLQPAHPDAPPRLELDAAREKAALLEEVLGLHLDIALENDR